jgi:hypothetical protein
MRSRIPQLIIGLLSLLLSSCGSLISIERVILHGPSTAPATGRATIFGETNSNPSIFAQGSKNVTWSVVSGGARLENSTGTRATVIMPQITTDGAVIIRAAAVDDPSKTTDISIRVIAPTTTLPASDFSNLNEGWDVLWR